METTWVKNSLDNTDTAKSIHNSLQYAKNLIEDSFNKIKKFNENMEDQESQSNEQTDYIHNQALEDEYREEEIQSRQSRKSSYNLPAISVSNSGNVSFTKSNRSSVNTSPYNLPRVNTFKLDDRVRTMIGDIDRTLAENYDANNEAEQLQQQVTLARSLLSDVLQLSNFRGFYNEDIDLHSTAKEKQLELCELEYKALYNKLQQLRSQEAKGAGDTKEIDREIETTKKRVQQLVNNVFL
eukprot:TRINITY_DN15456_c0_g1_i12.p1 TRINITY_DN15456_c0_g1~~TRINITY_DN15456_c0_g1_i12.p1  ORF type:complete len:270 (-),score=55.63 TRINITY_DN15456_c0_g1_i12:867-1583(-)